jgi:hypothetical protein
MRPYTDVQQCELTGGLVPKATKRENSIIIKTWLYHFSHE